MKPEILAKELWLNLEKQKINCRNVGYEFDKDKFEDMLDAAEAKIFK